LSAKDHPDLLQPFLNTVLAEGWSGPGGDLQEDKLQARAEPFDLEHIPAEVLATTVGADVQDDRIEASVLAWTKTGECLILGHFVIWGSFADSETWAEFDELLKSKWRHPWGGQLKVDAAVIDAGDGDHYDHVLAFCVPRTNRRVFAGKGMYGNRPGFAMAKGKRIAGKLALIGVDVLKSVIFDRLARGQGIRFAQSLEPSYYEQLASQRRVVRYHRGMPTRRFEMVSTRARKESLDCLTYGWAARQALVNVNFAMREEHLKNPAAPRRSLAELLAEQLPR
jgi:phage terminase large subunit GpA-like protein